MSTENPFTTLSNQITRIETILTEYLKKDNSISQKQMSRSEYVSVTEAAEFLGVSQGSIYRYVMTGVLPKKKFGNKLYFKMIDLENLIEKGVKQ